MKFINTSFQDLWVIEPNVHGDQRGYFYESFHFKKFEQETGLSPHFVQDNQSQSAYGVLRGLHFQYGEHAQAKLVRVLHGKVWDYVVDLRSDQSTFGQTFGIELSEQNKQQLFIPKGFAHGFIVLSEIAVFAYKCDNYYAPTHESGVIYNDPRLDFDWKVPVQDRVISEKDQHLATFAEIAQRGYF